VAAVERLPKDWVSSVPVYPGAGIVSSLSLTQPGSAAAPTPKDGAEKVAEFYAGKLTGKPKAKP
jgi:hypothetical protein